MKEKVTEKFNVKERSKNTLFRVLDSVIKPIPPKNSRLQGGNSDRAKQGMGESFSLSRLSLRSLAKGWEVGFRVIMLEEQLKNSILIPKPEDKEEMNILSRKLHELEKNVLPELPEKGTTKITGKTGMSS